jgi:hypothetical protein
VIHRPALHVLVLLGVLASLTACGGDQDRPVVVSTFPEQGAVLAGTIDVVRITFDDPVRLLNPAQIAVTTGGVTIPIVSARDPVDPHTLVVRPAVGQFWRVGRTSLLLVAGWEVNDRGHYRLENVQITFTLGAALPVYFGVPAPASVVHTEGPEFTPVATIPAPGGRSPVGLDCSTVGAQQRTWVQLADGGGTGEALAWFTRGEAAMTTVALTHDGAGDLVATNEALQVDALGRTLYVAFRDTALERVRLHRVDVATGLETDSLLLSPPASAATRPEGLALDPNAPFVYVACAASGGARLVGVDLATFTEVDLGLAPGIDGLLLPAGAGPAAHGDTSALVAPLAATEALLTTANADTGAVQDLPSVVLGSPTAILLTPDRRFVVESLAAYVDDEAVSYRLRSSATVEAAVVIDDDTGAGNGPATAMLDMAWFTGSTRLIALLDNDAAVYLRFLPGGIDQEDLDDSTPWAAVDLSGIAPGATLVAIPPPSVPVVP